MKIKNLAAIDIGSNGARLLIKRFNPEAPEGMKVRRITYIRVPLRLGKDVFTLGKVSKDRYRMMLHMMRGFKEFMKLNHVEAYRACATSAMRDAENGRKVMKRIHKQTGIRLEIIPGEEEAKLLANNILEAEDNNHTICYCDVGGGSTEISILHNGRLVDSHSYNCGTLRMLSGKVSAETLSELKENLSKVAKQYGEIQLIGSGGNINKLFKLTHNKSDKKEILMEELRQIYMKLKVLSIDERIGRYGLKEDRADVIIPASEIFMLVADALKTDRILVPNISLADSIVDGLFEQLIG